MIEKIFLPTLLLLLVSGCGAGETIQNVVDDAKDFISNDTQIANDGKEGNLTQKIQALLDVHNAARNELKAGISDLKWSDTIARDAQTYADKLAASGRFEHDPNNNPVDVSKRYENGIYGENLYASSISTSLAEAAQAWVDEKQYYTYGKIVDTSVEVDNTCVDGIDKYGNKILCGHYTQVIWKDTSLVGCAKSQYKAGTFKDGEVVVCKYQTPGNYIGQTPY